jgi:dimethylhistidine N-methyltransferase
MALQRGGNLGMMRDFGGPMQEVQVSSRFALTQGDPRAHLDDFATAVAEGLSRPQKSLPCRFLYDEVGSELFEEICDLPEYYLTRTEHALLERRADEIAALLPNPVALAELGSGSSSKTRLLIDALLRRQSALRYVPVDISRTALEDAARSLLSDYDALQVHAIADEYTAGLHHVHAETERPLVIAWLGSNVGNFERSAAAGFLAGVRGQLEARDRLLIGIDLRKDADALEQAYDDAAGVTARFNLNLLGRINRELGGHFDLDRFAHRAVYRVEEGRVELGIHSLEDQEVEIAALDSVAKFEKDEMIHTEDSYKYSLEEIDTLAAASGFEVERRWLDPAGAYSLNLLA